MLRPLSTRATYAGGGRVLLKTASGMKMYVDARDVSIAPHLILDGVWEEWTEAVLRKLLRPGMRVVEVGANVGYFTLVAAQCVRPGGRVVAFECDPQLARIARDNVEINGMHEIADVVEEAVAAEPGTLTFYRADRHRGNGSVVAGLEQLAHNPSDTRTALDVRATTLDAFCAASGWSPDLVKIDAEGAESAILRGARDLLSSRRPLTIVMEFVPRFVTAAGDDPARLLAELRSLGFAAHAIDYRRRTTAPVADEALLAADMSEVVFARGTRM